MTGTEASSAILIPIPYILASIIHQSIARSPVADLGLDGSKEAASSTDDWLLACALTSITLLLVGFRGLLGKTYSEADQSVTSLVSVGGVGTNWYSSKARSIVGRLLTVGLPFLATFKLGAARATLVLLLGLASNIVAIEDEITDLDSLKGWKRLSNHRRYTLGSIILQIFYDLTSLGGRSSADICLGYLALGLSMFCFPLSFPSSKPAASSSRSSARTSKSSTSSTIPAPWNMLPNPENMSTTVVKISPLTFSYEDTILTILSGGFMGILAVIIGLLSSRYHRHLFAINHMILIALSSSSAVMALFIAQPRSLRRNRGLGLVVGSILPTFLLRMTEINSWILFAFQSLLIGASFAALKLDSRIPLSTSSMSTHNQHQHQAKLHMEHGKMSSFSEFILRNAPQSQLLHSILVEKDSRRIFYFMWSVILGSLLDCMILTLVQSQLFIHARSNILWTSDRISWLAE